MKGSRSKRNEVIDGTITLTGRPLGPSRKVATANEHLWRIPYSGSRRKGIISVKTTERNGLAVGFLQVRDDDQIMLMAAQGKVLRCKVDDIREIGRNTQGVRILDLDGEGDRVVGVARLAEVVEREDAGSEDTPEA